MDWPRPIAAPLLFLLLCAGPVGPSHAVPVRPTTSYLMEIAVFEVRSNGDGSAELDAEQVFWAEAEPDRERFRKIAAFRGPTVLDYTHRLQPETGGAVFVTLLDRDRRRVRLLVSEWVDDERVDRIATLRLDRSLRPAKGRLVLPLHRAGRWIRIHLRRT